MLSHATSRRARAKPARLDNEILLLSGVVILGATVSILDTTIVNVALVALERDFHAPLSSIQWVAAGYMLALTAAIPITGWAIERFGARRIWLASVAAFTGTSVLCGMAPSLAALVFARVLQGFAGGIIMPVGMAMLTQAAGPTRLGRVMSFIGVPIMVAPVFGPVLGGFLVDHASWRWCFFVNVPFGVAAYVLAAAVLPRARPVERPKLDVIGMLLLSPGLALFIYGISLITLAKGFEDGVGNTAVVLGTLALAGFLVRSLRLGSLSLLDIRVFRDRSFSASALTSVVFGVAMFGAMILLPLYFQLVRGRSATETGFLLMPQGIGMAMAMPFAGRFTDRVGAGRVVPVGITITLLGMLPLAFSDESAPIAVLLGAQFAIGIGGGMSMMPAFASAFHSLDRGRIPRATAALNVVQRFGSAIGASLVVVILNNFMASAVPGLSTGVDGAPAANEGVVTVPTSVAHALSGAFNKTYLVVLAVIAVVYVPAAFLPGRAASDVEAIDPPFASTMH